MKKNLKKGVQIVTLGAALTAGTTMFTGCPHSPEPQEPGTEIDNPGTETPSTPTQNYEFYTLELGYEGSGINSYCWMNEFYGDEFPLPEEGFQKYGAKYHAYLNKLITELENSIQDQNTRNYLAPYLDQVKSLPVNLFTSAISYTFDSIVYDESQYIFENLMDSLSTPSEWEGLYYPFVTLSNEAYRRGRVAKNYLGEVYFGGDAGQQNYTAGYRNKKYDMIDYLYYCDMSETDAKNDIENNNSSKITRIFIDNLQKAINNLNNQRNLNLTLDQAKQLINIILSARAMGSMYSSLYNAQDCTTFDYAPNLESCVKEYFFGLYENYILSQENEQSM